MYRALLLECMLKYASNMTCKWNCVQETVSLATALSMVTMEYLKTLPLLPRALIWIDFNLPHIGVQTKLKHLHVYQQHPNIQNHLTPIVQKIAEIQIRVNSLHIITRIQFSIQLAMTHTIH
jgi:hypothetical protein